MHVIPAVAAALFVLETTAPVVQTWSVSPLLDGPAISAQATPADPVVSDCGRFEVFMSKPDHELTAQIEFLRNDRGDRGTGVAIA